MKLKRCWFSFQSWTLPQAGEETEAQGLAPHDLNALSHVSVDSRPTFTRRVRGRLLQVGRRDLQAQTSLKGVLPNPAGP